MQPEIPDHIGRFVVRSVLGVGAHAVVYLAVDPALGREVAIKVVRRSDSDAIELFSKEGQIASRLEHPSIVPVHELGQTDSVGISS